LRGTCFTAPIFTSFCLQANSLYLDPSLDFHVDIGCARGAYCLDFARQNPGVNVLGLEIRRPVAAYCAQQARESGLGNVGFLSCNANVDLYRVLDGINKASRVSRLSIQFPDPHFKARHQKRRVVQPQLIEAIASRTDSDCEVFLQSDIHEVALEMRERFREHPAFQDTVESIDTWIDENPTGISTEREVATFAKGLPVFRSLLLRC
jgi:tRNA (guanine-N7-)-methyltransferase